MSDTPSKKLVTRLIHKGRDPKAQNGSVNPPIHRASTILLDDASQLYAPGTRTYGLDGLQVHDSLKEALCELEKAKHCQLVESGLLACTLPIFALVGAGEHVLIPDNTYGPTRRYCDRSLKRTGGCVTYYDPDIGAGIADLIQDNTRFIMIESPGSLTFELPDIRTIVAAAKERGVITALDNCWASGYFLNPLELGVDISIIATTKYIGGHSDTLSGAILTRDDKLTDHIKAAKADLGLSMAPEDASLVLRGLRTLAVRMKQHEASALKIANWLESHPDVQQVLHPALPSNPYYELWKRDFTGSSGLFSFVLADTNREGVHAFLNAVELFGLGFSYGGYESLIINCDPQLFRGPTFKGFPGPLIRLAIGLEDTDDLIADLEKGFAARTAAMRA